MSTGGRGIPRLQEVTYLEIAAVAASEEVPFEGIRRRMVDHMIQISQENPGTGNAVAAYRPAIENPKRYVRNVTEALKELMRLGLVHQANLPASASSAGPFKNTQYALTDDGIAWVKQLADNRAAAYDHLVTMLMLTHPQFAGFIKIVQDGFAVPTARWTDVAGNPTRERYLDFLSERTSFLLAKHNFGWSASESDVREALVGYTTEIANRAEAREKPDPFARNQDFVNTCEEALVKFAFKKAGVPIDYISHEILRRWTKTLVLANFSYYVPGPALLRFWPTADIELVDGQLRIERRVGKQWQEEAVASLGEAYERTRADARQNSLWVPIYRLRAAACSKLRISDREFDIAIRAFLAKEIGEDLPFRVNVDQAMYGGVPPSERPLIVPTRTGPRTYHSISVVPKRTASTNPKIDERTTS